MGTPQNECHSIVNLTLAIRLLSAELNNVRLNPPSSTYEELVESLAPYNAAVQEIHKLRRYQITAEAVVRYLSTGKIPHGVSRRIPSWDIADLINLNVDQRQPIKGYHRKKRTKWGYEVEISRPITGNDVELYRRLNVNVACRLSKWSSFPDIIRAMVKVRQDAYRRNSRARLLKYQFASRYW